MPFKGGQPMHAWILLLAMLLTGCAGYNPFADEAPEDLQNNEVRPLAPVPSTSMTPKTAVSPSSDMELRLAKLWARVDDLENQQIRQKERMKLLEKGLMLGIVPDEL